MSDTNTEEMLSKLADKPKMFVCTPEEWAQLVQFVGSLPASAGAGAYVWLSQKQPKEVAL